MYKLRNPFSHEWDITAFYISLFFRSEVMQIEGPISINGRVSGRVVRSDEALQLGKQVKCVRARWLVSVKQASLTTEPFCSSLIRLVGRGFRRKSGSTTIENWPEILKDESCEQLARITRSSSAPLMRLELQPELCLGRLCAFFACSDSRAPQAF